MSKIKVRRGIGKKGMAGILTAAVIASLAVLPVSAKGYDANNPPVADTAQGQVKGYMDEDTYAFLGIPYASAGRFEEPREAEPWEGVRSAQSYGTVCPVAMGDAVPASELAWPHRFWYQNEDCMNLNVWTPSLEKKAKKPVIVFFHGGGYYEGSSIEGVAYEGKNLSDYGDAVVVSVNHRLNVLGFLDLTAYGEKYKGTSNLGIKDLVASLKWVQKNIANFGGDPDNVTIMGQSGGGGKVTTLMRTPAAEGLFDKAICMSGIFGGSTKEDSQKVGAELLKKLGLDKSKADTLKTMDYNELIKAGTEVLGEVGASWSPVNDGEYIMEDYCDWAKDIPFMAGTVYSEFNNNWKFEGPHKNEWSEEEAVKNLTEKYGDKGKEIAEEFKKVFPGRTVADAYFYAAAGSDISRKGVEGILNHRLEKAKAPVYEYLFDYEAPVNGGRLAFHCCELSYAFHNLEIPIITRATGGSKEAFQVQDQMAGAIIAFASTGSPGTKGLEWKPYTAKDKNIMVFSEKSNCRILGDEKLCSLIEESTQKK